MEKTVEEAKKLLGKKNVVFLDVRTEEEALQKSIPGSILIDVHDPSFALKVQNLDKSKEYIVYCRSGGRSAHAVAFMGSLGFKAYTLLGGIIAWID